MVIPTVSVVIPCFNQGQFLGDAINSALSGTQLPMEIIVINDGSSDQLTLEEFDRVERADSVTIVHQTNKGLAAARNAGISRARGEFIQLLDADDLIANDKIDKQIAYLRARPELDAVICDYFICNEEKTEFEIPTPSHFRDFKFDLNEILFKWERGLSIPIHTALLRRDAISPEPFKEGLIGKEDWVFWSIAVNDGLVIGYLQERLAFYRQHDSNMCKLVGAMAESWLVATTLIARNIRQLPPDFVSQSVAHYNHYYFDKVRGESESESERFYFTLARRVAIQLIRLERKFPGCQRIAEVTFNFFPRITHVKNWRTVIRNLTHHGRGICFKLLNRLVTVQWRLLYLTQFWLTPIRRAKRPKISIVIPVYNHSIFLEQCIESALRQSYCAMDIVCVDDCSPDTQVKVILDKYFSHSQIKIVRLEQNVNTAAATNIAVEHAEGDWIAFLDCDDYLPRNALKYAARAIRKFPKSQFFFSDRIKVDKDGNNIGREIYGSRPDLLRYDHRDNLIDSMIASHLKVMSKHLFESLGGCDPTLSGVQDFDLALKSSEQTTLCYIPAALYFHRSHDAAQTQTSYTTMTRRANIARRHALEQRWRPAMSKWHPMKTEGDSLASTLWSHIVLNGCFGQLPHGLYYMNEETLHTLEPRQDLSTLTSEDGRRKGAGSLLLVGFGDDTWEFMKTVWAAQGNYRIIYVSPYDFHSYPNYRRDENWFLRSSSSFFDYIVVHDEGTRIALDGYLYDPAMLIFSPEIYTYRWPDTITVCDATVAPQVRQQNIRRRREIEYRANRTADENVRVMLNGRINSPYQDAVSQAVEIGETGLYGVYGHNGHVAGEIFIGEELRLFLKSCDPDRGALFVIGFEDKNLAFVRDEWWCTIRIPVFYIMPEYLWEPDVAEEYETRFLQTTNSYFDAIIHGPGSARRVERFSKFLYDVQMTINSPGARPDAH